MICYVAAAGGLKRALAVKKAFEFEVEHRLKGTKEYPDLSREQIESIARKIRMRMMEEEPEHYAEFIKHIEY